MGLIVTGLSPQGDVSALRAALHDAGLSSDGLQVIGPDDSTLDFRRAGTIGGGIAGDNYGSGTSVPGITNVHRPQGYFRSEDLDDRLSDLDIPESELGNYAEAIERGRSVVAYTATPESIGRVEEIFRGSNLLNIKRY